MRILLASASLKVPGGSETYLLTLGRHLQRLGHDIVVVEQDGPVGNLVNDAGLIQIAMRGRLEAPPDRIIVQDAIVAAETAAAWPEVPQLFVAHSVIHDLQMTDALPSTVAAIAALNDRSANRAKALAARIPVVRLRQPIDVGHFAPGPPPRQVPRTMVIFGNNTAEWRTSSLRRECNRRGIDVVRVGGDSRVADPAAVLRAADIVVGYGRCVLEAMACGRTVAVVDRFGSDGWVNADTYAALEASGFNGSAGIDLAGRDDFADVLDAYDASTGAVLHDLAYRHHDAREHAATVVDLIASLGPVRPADTSLSFALARTWRQQWYWEQQAIAGRVAEHALRDHEVMIEELRSQLTVAAQREALLVADAHSAQRLGSELADVLASTRYRIGATLADAALKPLRLMRSLRRKG